MRTLYYGLMIAVTATVLGAVPLATRAMGGAMPPSLPPGDPVHGEKLYAVCMGCHSIDDNDVGPRHRGVVGRPAGSVPGYAYSAALKASHIVWTPVNLDRWLQGPQKLVPGAKMFVTVAKPADRADLIAYLATQK